MITFSLQLQRFPSVQHCDNRQGRGGKGDGGMGASQLVRPKIYFNLLWTTFGLLRPLHSNLVIVDFDSSTQFDASYYAVQRRHGTRRSSPSSPFGVGSR